MRRKEIRKHEKKHVIKKYKQVRTGIGLFLLVFLLGGYWHYVFAFRPMQEPDMFENDTNEDAVLYTKEEQRVVLKGFETLYQLAYADDAYEDIIIPGLKTTKTIIQGSENEIDVCTSMTPQGLCIAEDYVLISAYCHTNRHHSVLYVLDKYSYTFVKEIVLDGDDHVGGIAYDTEHQNVWISTNKNGKATASGFALKALERYHLEQRKKPIQYTYEYFLYALPRDSFMTCHSGYLYVGCFESESESIVQKYKIYGNGGLKKENIVKGRKGQPYICKDSSMEKYCMPQETKRIPKRIQGIAFGKDKLLLSRSYGLSKSELYVYDMNIQGNILEEQAIAKITMPQKMQQIFVEGNELYVLFESAAYAYRSQPVPKVDRILKLNIEEYLDV